MTHVWSRSLRMSLRNKHPIRDRTRFPIWPNLTVELKTIVNEHIKAAQSDNDGQHTLRFSGLLQSIFQVTLKVTDYFLHHLLKDANNINNYQPYNFYLKEALDEQLHVLRKPVIHETVVHGCSASLEGHSWLKPSEGSSADGTLETSDHRNQPLRFFKFLSNQPSHMGLICNVTRAPCIEHSDLNMMSGNAACNTLQGGRCIGIPGSNSYQCKIPTVSARNSSSGSIVIDLAANGQNGLSGQSAAQVVVHPSTAGGHVLENV
ncbi:hypothetical protein AHF37_02759 [Paragonimus kellicotti]|nr:hypothetical protein AHF37_02759 [Paragonimus kellicotti]